MFRSILVPVDLTDPESFSNAAPQAVELCRTSGASLTLMTVVMDVHLMLEAGWISATLREMLSAARAQLRALADTIEGVGEVGCQVEAGSIYGTIVSVSERLGADLIVLAAHRPAMKDYLLGTNASRVVRHAGCSVLVVRG